MANLSSAVVELSSSRVLLADNNAHPNPAHLKMMYVELAWMERVWSWVDWAGFGVEQFYPDTIDNLNSQNGKNSIKSQDLLQTLIFKFSIFELKFNFKKIKSQYD